MHLKPVWVGALLLRCYRGWSVTWIRRAQSDRASDASCGTRRDLAGGCHPRNVGPVGLETNRGLEWRLGSSLKILVR